MAMGSIAAAGLGAAGSIMQGQSTANALDAQSNLQLQNAQEAEEQGQFNATKQQITSGQKIGAITANFGASGVRSDSGSAIDVLSASNMNAELDRQNILHGADVKAINFENQASMDKLGADSAIKGSYWSALGTLGVGGASAWSKAYSGATPQTGNNDGMADDMGQNGNTGFGGSDSPDGVSSAGGAADAGSAAEMMA